MKGVLRTIGKFFSTFFGLVVALFVGIGFLLYLPFDYVKYKVSPYYKTFRKKYKLYSGMSSHFDIYNVVLEHQLPIEYIENPTCDRLSYGWFVCDKTLLIPSAVSWEYRQETEEWFYEEEHGEPISLDRYIAEEIQEVNEVLGRTVCEEGVVLFTASYDQPKRNRLAKEDDRILLYYDDLAQVLTQFCNKKQGESHERN